MAPLWTTKSMLFSKSPTNRALEAEKDASSSEQLAPDGSEDDAKSRAPLESGDSSLRGQAQAPWRDEKAE
jgi:hypothetical protein